MSQIEEDNTLSDINDPEYNRLLDTGAKSSRSFKDSVIEAAKRLENY